MPKIYHYTKLSTAIEYILPTMKLRTNFLNKMNGPKENQKWAFGGINIDLKRIYPKTYTKETHIEHMYKLGEEIKSNVQALCFVHSDVHPGYENEMMWAQYSENHRGVCLEIDLDLFIEENKDKNIYKFDNIDYSSSEEDVYIYWEREHSKEANINRIIRNHYLSLFLTKSHYWNKEHEKRLLVLSDEYNLFNISKSLTGIYYGLFFNYSYHMAVKQFIDSKHTSICRVYYEKNQLNKMEIDR